MKKINQPVQDSTKIAEFKQQLEKTDNRIFLIITFFLTNSALIAVFDIFLDKGTDYNNYLIATYPYLSGIFEVIELILSATLIFFIIYLFLLFKKHFKLRALLGQKGVDSLAEKLKDFFQKWTGDDKNNPDFD